MSFFEDFQRGYGDARPGAMPYGFAGDELTGSKAVMAGLLEENTGLKAVLAQWQAAVAERDDYIAALAAERDQACAARDRYQANGKRALAQLKELQSIIAFPGARNALLKALHPDTGTGGDVASRNAITQRLNAVWRGIGR